MDVMESRVFKNGNSAAVRLPAALGIVPGTRVSIEQMNGGVTIKPMHDPEEVRRDLAEMFADIQAIWAAAGGAPPPEPRDRIEFPDRPGLYD